jgi:hypothetical protein
MKRVPFRASFVACFERVLVPALAAAMLAGCVTSLPVPDPREPGPVQDGPVVLRVCFVDGDGAHLSVGDQVELTTSSGGRLTIRHIRGPGNQGGLWNGGEAVAVRAAILVERVAPRGNQTNVRRFVPVGQFAVRLGDAEPHALFDFQASKVVRNLTSDRFPECNAAVGDDNVLVRGVPDKDRHGGIADLRD